MTPDMPPDQHQHPVHTGITVFTNQKRDADQPPLVRALHAELCGNHPHAGSGAPPACQRAWLVVQRWNADLQTDEIGHHRRQAADMVGLTDAVALADVEQRLRRGEYTS